MKFANSYKVDPPFTESADQLAQYISDHGVDLLTEMHLENFSGGRGKEFLSALSQAGCLETVRGVRHDDSGCDHWTYEGYVVDGDICLGCGQPLLEYIQEDRYSWIKSLPRARTFDNSPRIVNEFHGLVSGAIFNQFAGDMHMSENKYQVQAQNVGAVGDNATGTVNSNTDTVQMKAFIEHLDLDEAGQQLEQLLSVVKQRASGSNEFAQALALAEAKEKAEIGDKSGFLEALKKCGAFVVDVAKEIGSKIVVEYFNHRLAG